MPTLALLLLLAPRIAFLSERGPDQRDGLYEMAADGSDVVRLVPETRDVMHFALAPDGTRLAFVCDPGEESFTLHVLDRARGTETAIRDGIRWYPAWSPDGTRLAFMTHTGGWRIRLTAPDVVVPRPPQDRVGGDGAPAWAADGSFVVFQSNRDENLELYRHDVATGEPRRLTDTAEAETRPRVSPDGRWIAYERARGIWLMRPDGTQQQKITEDDAQAGDPTWSPDSTRIAFVADGDIAVIELTTRKDRVMNLTRHAATNSSPAWSPDGTRLLFVSDRDGNDEIYELVLDGRQVRRLTESPGRDHAPAWIPDATGK